MPAYITDEELEKTNEAELQAELIANRILRKLEETQMSKAVMGMDDESIINAIQNIHPNIGSCEIHRGAPSKTGRYTSINISIITPQVKIKLIERIYPQKDRELRNYKIMSNYTLSIPKIIHIDADKGLLLMEDLNDTYIQCNYFNTDGDSGLFIRENYYALLKAAAKYHAVFWDNYNAFAHIGLDWRLENRENLLCHINGLEKDYKKYRIAEENGKIPKVWNIFENTIELGKLDYFQTAIDILREKYIDLIDTRFVAGKNITAIHGDLHPGNIFISKTEKTIKFIDMEAVRMGLCTEDLAMLLALHIEPDKKHALLLLQYYHSYLCEIINDYSFDLLLSDYKISIMENMFFTIRLINRGIYDFSMRDKSMRAFETFVLNIE